MSSLNYKQSLIRQKTILDQQIFDETHKSYPDTFILTQLKREKLAIKDKIQRL